MLGSISTALATLDFVPPREARAHFPEQRLVIEPTMEDKRTWDFLKARCRFARLATCSKSTCEKKPFQVNANDNFLIGFGFIPSSPPPPPRQCFVQKSALFYPFCSKFNFVWGGREGVSSFTNITGKAPTLLTYIAVLSIQPFSPRP